MQDVCLQGAHDYFYVRIYIKNYNLPVIFWVQRSMLTIKVLIAVYNLLSRYVSSV